MEGILYKNTKIIFAILFLLIVVVVKGCPPSCECSVYHFKCRRANLKEVPKDISKLVKYIDLSQNPSIHIERWAFRKFQNLETLLLNKCGLKRAIFLPMSMQQLALAENMITDKILEEMLSTQLPSLKGIDLMDNQLNITKALRSLPESIEALKFTGNSMITLKRDDLQCCKHLRKFECESCGLQVIEPSTFDDVKDISTINLPSNELAALPNRLFKHNRKILTLDLSANRIECFNSTQLQLKRLTTLKLGYNKLKSFDLQSTQIVDINLEANKVTSLGADEFGSSPFIHALCLQDNEISQISPRAFHNVKFISVLLLQNNMIESLPEHVFNNTQIGKMFLHRNKLSNINGVLEGMRRTPHLLTLFMNKEFHYLNMSNFKRMSETSTVFITCRYLKGIARTSKLKAAIKCSPSAEIVFQSPLRLFSYVGYSCKWHSDYFQFVCRACPVGHFCDGNSSRHKMGRCIKCPPGSFYQDEVASTGCKNCPLGQYVPPKRSPGKDPSECQTCPHGTNTNNSAGTRACRCLQGYYRTYRFGPCEKCNHQGFECTRDYPVLAKGYWMTWNQATQMSCKDRFQAFISNLETYDDSYDRRTATFNCQLPLATQCPIPDSCSGGIDASCASGYTGVLCAVCSRGHSKHFNRCVKCPHAIIVIFEFAGYAAMFIFLCFIISLTDKVTLGKNSEQQANGEYRTVADVIISSIKISIGFYQILVGIMHAFSCVKWPNSLLKTVSVLEYIQFEVIRIPSLRCIKPEWNIDSIKEFWFVLLLTLTMQFLSVLFFLIKLFYLRFHETNSFEFKRKRDLCGSSCIKFAALFLFVTYPLTSSRIFAILPISCHSFCIAKHNGTCQGTLSYLRSDYNIRCPISTQYKHTLMAAYCCLAIPLGLPVLLLYLLWNFAPKKKHQRPYGSVRFPVLVIETIDEMILEESNLAGSVNSDYLNDGLSPGNSPVEREPMLTNALKFAYENYNESCWFWEGIELIRKLVMTVGVTIFLNHTKIGLASVIILAMAFAILHAVKKPIKDRFENFVQLLSLLMVPMNLCVGAVLRSRVNEDPEYSDGSSDSMALGIFLVSINSMIPLLLIGRFLKVMLKKILHK